MIWVRRIIDPAGYVIEGHVPAALITRLLAEKPQVARLAVPGMPVGFPGMEVGGWSPTPTGGPVRSLGPAHLRTVLRWPEA